MLVEVEIDLDKIIEESGQTALVAQSDGTWLLYLSGEQPIRHTDLVRACIELVRWEDARRAELAEKAELHAIRSREQAEQDGRDAAELIQEITRKKEKDGI